MFEVQNHTSKYTGVTWHKEHNKWHARLSHNKKNYHGNYYDNEEHAAMNVNSLCDRFGIQRKNPEINIDVIQKVMHSLYIGTSKVNSVFVLLKRVRLHPM